MTLSAQSISRHAAAGVALWALSLIVGCASLLPKAAAPPELFALDDTTPVANTATLMPLRSAPTATLIVNTPRAAAGFDTAHIVYRRQAHEIEYFAANQWVDTPSQMLAPLIARAIERTAAYRAVVRAPSAVAGELRLDTELIRLQQEFATSPSRVRLTLHAVLIDTTTRRVVAWREFDASVPAPSDDPHGGVAATQQAVQRVLAELAAFCAEAAVR